MSFSEGHVRWKPLTRTALKTAAFLGLSLATAVVLFHFVFQPFQVAGLSMAPCLEDQDYLLVDRLFFRGTGLKRGDLVIFSLEGDPRFMVKRIVGLPGEEVSAHEGILRVNGVPVPADPSRGEAYPDFGPARVPPDSYFCVGDNPSVSLDSRTFGPVARERIYGRPVLRYLPLHRSGFLRQAGAP